MIAGRRNGKAPREGGAIYEILGESSSICSILRMKWFFGHVGGVLTAIASILIADRIRRGNTLDRWGEHLTRLTGEVRDPVAKALATAWSAVVIAALAIAVFFAIRLLVTLCYRALEVAPLVYTRMRIGLKMSEFVNKTEAIAIINDSDFVRSRQPGANTPTGPLFDSLEPLRNLGQGPSRREKMVANRFLRNVLEAFQEQRPDSVSDQGYHRETLESWLEELFAAEVRKEMGSIPKV